MTDLDSFQIKIKLQISACFNVQSLRMQLIIIIFFFPYGESNSVFDFFYLFQQNQIRIRFFIITLFIICKEYFQWCDTLIIVKTLHCHLTRHTGLELALLPAG